jgi:hypothetical protein
MDSSIYTGGTNQMAKKVILGVLLSMVVMLMVGTAALAAPNPDRVPCVVYCNPNGPNGVYPDGTKWCGAGANNVAQHLIPILDFGGPGASDHAHMTLAEVVDKINNP